MNPEAHPDQVAPESEQTSNEAAKYAVLANTPLVPDGEHIPPTESAPETEEAPQKLRAAQIEWLKGHDALEETPHLAMSRREYDLLREVGIGDGGDATSRIIDQTKQNYGIPPGAQYALVDIVPNDASQPRTAKLVVVNMQDFGTTVDAGRLESQGIGLEDLPHVTMNEREFKLFGIAGMHDGGTSSLIKYARDLCGVPQQDPRDPQNDQYAPRYALIDIKPDDPSLPNDPKLVKIDEADFGTAIDPAVIERHNASSEPNLDPDSPLTPESGGTYATVDIGNALYESWEGLRTFASNLMGNKTENPLSERFWVRAGGLFHGQKDAYVWENSRPFTSAVELTIAFPGQYKSVCAVVGDRQDPRNGKGGMAQIKDPEVILTIEGEDLKRLQDVYRQLYNQPNFALTKDQRKERDKRFNNDVAGLISDVTRKNKEREDEERRRRYESYARQPQLRARPLPGSDSYRNR